MHVFHLYSYKLRIEGMLLKEEFASNMSYLEPSINSMVIAAEDLMTNKPLQEVLYMILVAGNFLNSVRITERENLIEKLIKNVTYRGAMPEMQLVLNFHLYKKLQI